MLNHEWKDGELDYCLQLVVDGGNENVGHSRANVVSYLRLQAGCATTDKEMDNASLLYSLAGWCERDGGRYLNQSGSNLT